MKEELVGLGVPCDQVGTNIVDDETGTVRTAWSTVESDALQDPDTSRNPSSRERTPD